MNRIAGILLVLSLLLAGCGARPTASPAFSLEYRRSGGIAGVDDHLTIDAGGHATLERRGQATEFDLNQATLDRLRTLLDQAGFDRLDADYPPPPGSADLFEYAVTYQGKTVRMADTVIPSAMQEVVDRLNQIVDLGRQP